MVHAHARGQRGEDGGAALGEGEALTRGRVDQRECGGARVGAADEEVRGPGRRRWARAGTATGKCSPHRSPWPAPPCSPFSPAAVLPAGDPIGSEEGCGGVEKRGARVASSAATTGEERGGEARGARRGGDGAGVIHVRLAENSSAKQRSSTTHNGEVHGDSVFFFFRDKDSFVCDCSISNGSGVVSCSPSICRVSSCWTLTHRSKVLLLIVSYFVCSPFCFQ